MEQHDIERQLMSLYLLASPATMPQAPDLQAEIIQHPTVWLHTLREHALCTYTAIHRDFISEPKVRLMDRIIVGLNARGSEEESVM